MSKDFAFMLAQDADFKEGALFQGDIIERSMGVIEGIREAHEYYASAQDYEYFLVLTPTCDLVRRNGNKCKAKYITIAAVRPLKVLIDRELVNYKRRSKEGVMLLQKERRRLAEQFVERLIHNSVPAHIFLPGEFFEDKRDRCAFLHLSIALKPDLYDILLGAKKLQLADSFSTLVGVSSSRLYGQIATPAIEEQADVNYQEIMSNYKERILDDKNYYWITEAGNGILNQRIANNPDVNIQSLLTSMPDDQSILSEKIVEIMKSYLQKNALLSLSDEDSKKLINVISNETSFKKFLLNKG